MKLDFNKGKGLVPVIIQNTNNLQVLMLGYMNEEAYEKTVKEKKVTFFSRSKQRLWTKGETSGNFLVVDRIDFDCDQDSMLIQASPIGPTCHQGSNSCFKNDSSKGFLYELESTISERASAGLSGSYTANLLAKGINKVAQKVGEEAVELVIEAKDNNADLFQNEAADLLYHFLVLLKAKEFELSDIEEVLLQRSNKEVEEKFS